MAVIINTMNSRPSNTRTICLNDIVVAEKNIRGYLPVTPLTHSPSISEIAGFDVYLKWDNKFPTGSFKERGAVNFLTSLNPQEKIKGVCAASAGNHALALSKHAASMSIPCKIVMPTSAPLIKVENTRRYGAKIILRGTDFDEAYSHALQIADQEELTFVPAFDDRRIITGQGTCGLEIINQLPDLDTIITSIGGGGLISGIATVVKSQKPDVRIIGVQSEWAAAGRKAKQPLPDNMLPPGTLADGIGVKRVGKLTGPIVDQYVDEVLTMTEPEIANAIVKFLILERTVVEGAGAAALGPLLQGKISGDVKKAVVVVSGSNIDINLLSRLIDRDLRKAGRLSRLRVSVPDRPGSLATVTGIISSLGANVLETFHDRSFSLTPGSVDITFLLEVRNAEHRDALIEQLIAAGTEAQEL